MPRLLRLTPMNTPLWPSRFGPKVRDSSPLIGSTLMTSAPQSPSIAAASGPATMVAASITRMPDKAPGSRVEAGDVVELMS